MNVKLLFIFTLVIVLPTQAFAAKKKIKPKLIAGNYVVVGTLSDGEGACNLINATGTLANAVQIGVDGKNIMIQSLMPLEGKLKSNGKYYATEQIDITGNSFLRETLQGKFKKNKKSGKVVFRGTQIFESFLAGSYDCYLKYKVTYQQF